MLYDIAITPDVFEYAASHDNGGRELENLWTLLDENVLIANLHGGEWVKFVGNLKLTPLIKDQVQCHLIKYQNSHRIFECPSDNTLTPVDGWFQYTIKELEKRTIDAVVTCESTRLKNNFSNDAIIDFPLNPRDSFLRKIKDAQQQPITKDKSQLRDVLAPFLRHAKTVKLIDSYIAPDIIQGKNKEQKEVENERRNRYKNVIELIADLLGNFQNQQLPGTIEIYTSVSKNDHKKRIKQIEMDVAQYKSDWETFLIEISRKLYNHNVTVILLGVDKNKQFLHDRFILTDLAGISLPAEIEENKTKEEIWTLLQEKNWRSEFLKYTYRIPYKIEKKVSFALFANP